jgi:hypothetical protein
LKSELPSARRLETLCNATDSELGSSVSIVTRLLARRLEKSSSCFAGGGNFLSPPPDRLEGPPIGTGEKGLKRRARTLVSRVKG